MALIFAFIVALIILAVAIWGFCSDRPVFYEHWVPALITGLFLVGILPIANEIYWKRQKDYEICVQDREKRYSLMGSTAKTYTSIFKVHTRLYELAKEKSKEEKNLQKLAPGARDSDGLAKIYLDRVARLDQLKSDLEKELIQQQSQIGSDSALVSRYLPTVQTKYFQLANMYDERVSKVGNFLPTKNDPLVKGVSDLVASMAQEALTNEHQCK
jgi:hypothetical protein